MKFFCLECKACVCQICINTDHKSHDVDPLEKAADETKVNIVAAAVLLKEKRKVCNDVIREYEETALKLDSNIKSAKLKSAKQQNKWSREFGNASEKPLPPSRIHACRSWTN